MEHITEEISHDPHHLDFDDDDHNRNEKNIANAIVNPTAINNTAKETLKSVGDEGYDSCDEDFTDEDFSENDFSDDYCNYASPSLVNLKKLNTKISEAEEGIIVKDNVVDYSSYVEGLQITKAEMETFQENEQKNGTTHAGFDDDDWDYDAATNNTSNTPELLPEEEDRYKEEYSCPITSFDDQEWKYDDANSVSDNKAADDASHKKWLIESWFPAIFLPSIIEESPSQLADDSEKTGYTLSRRNSYTVEPTIIMEEEVTATTDRVHNNDAICNTDDEEKSWNSLNAVYSNGFHTVKKDEKSREEIFERNNEKRSQTIEIMNSNDVHKEEKDKKSDGLVIDDVTKSNDCVEKWSFWRRCYYRLAANIRIFCCYPSDKFQRLKNLLMNTSREKEFGYF